MRRRDFMATVVGATGAAMTSATAMPDEHGQENESAQQFYELRRYHLQSSQDRAMLDTYWKGAAVPAYNRLGVNPVGVFEPAEGTKEVGKVLYALLPYSSLQHMIDVRRKLPRDKKYQRAAEAYLSTPKNDPAYERIESKLMIAFAGQPQLRVPELTKQDKPRLFELRTYESHNEHKARLKVEMFNEAEMDLFLSLGFPPAVFHGDTVIGKLVPNLSYMLVYEDRKQRDALWKKFINSEGWKKLSGVERYKNTVSKVHNWFMRPTDYSQL